MQAMERPSIRVIVEDDLERSRLTVFFRLLLAIPHLIWLLLWSIGALVAVIVNWFATLALGRSPDSLHGFLAAYVRYATHVFAYLSLAANPFPGFTGEAGSYPVDVEIDPPARQNRWKTGFRIVLAIPALILANALAGGPGGGGGGGARSDGSEADAPTWFDFSGSGLIVLVAFLAWFVCLARGRMPLGFRDFQTYALRYGAQAWGYLLFLTDRYPNSDLATPPASPPPQPQTIRIAVDDDLRRSRLTVLFRLLLFLPHLVWFLLWSIAAFFAVIVGWFVTLAAGRMLVGLHRFLAAYIRYGTHISAYVFIVANPFPGFTGTEGTYPVDLEVDPPARQSRWITLFRLFLAIPASLISGGLGSVLVVVGVFGWFVGLVTGRMPVGLRNLGVYAVRYSAQAHAYLYLLTDRYPYTGPWEWSAPGPSEDAEPEVAAA
jgi:hypothetical protein